MPASSTERPGGRPRPGEGILPQAAEISACAARVAAAGDEAMLAACARDARDIAVALESAGAGSALVTITLSRLNDAITERLLTVIERRFRLPPARWCWLGLGSEGRLEQTLATDQDNGLLFSASSDAEAKDLRELFLPFARAANAALAECGFPLCDGEVMAGNPRWCLSQSEWLQRFSAWVRTPEPEALLNAAIFFDFLPLAGTPSLGAELRVELSKLTRGNEIFLRMMAMNALAAEPPLGRLRDFAPGPGRLLDLKKFGSRIFVDAARILALAIGAKATATDVRLQQIAGSGIIPSSDATAATHAFHALQGIRLSAQAQAIASGAPADNLIDPESLNEFDRRLLLEALRQARALQQRLKTRFQIQ